MVPHERRPPFRPHAVPGAAFALLFFAACNAILGITPGQATGSTASATGSGGATTSSTTGSGGATTSSATGSGGATTSSTGSTGSGGATTSSTSSTSGTGGSDAGPTCQGPGGLDGTTFGWLKHAGNDGDAGGKGLAFTADGGVIVGGTFSDNLTTIEGPSLAYPTPDGGYEGSDLFVAKYKADGTPLWSVPFSGADDQAMTSLVLDKQENIILAGYLRGGVTFGTKGTLVSDQTRSIDAEDAFVAKLDKNGQPVWARRFGGPEDDLGMQAVVDSAGDVILLGVTFGGFMPGGAMGDFGCPTPTTIPLGDDTLFVVKLAGADGTPRWCQTYDFWVSYYNINNRPSGLSLAIDRDDGVLLAGGGYVSTANFGLGNPNGYGGLDVFVVKLDAGGNAVWQATFGDDNDQYVTKVAVDACGDVILGGGFNTSVTFAPLPAVTIAADGDAGSTSGYEHMFLAKLTPTANPNAPLAPVWLQTYADVGIQDITGLVVNATSDIAVTANLYDAVGSMGLQFGNELLPPSGSDGPGDYRADMLLAKFKPDGTPRWARRYGGIYTELAGAVALDALGHTLATGAFSEKVDFGGGQVMPNGQNLFLLELGP